MKHFKTVTYTILSVIIILFAVDIACMVSLYGSIKDRYMDDMEQCLRRADLIEFIDRLSVAGYGEDGVIEIWLGLQKCDVGAAKTVEELHELDYSQGYRRMDIQLISVVTNYLHNAYGDDVGVPDLHELENIFRRELNFSGFFPKDVIVVPQDGCIEYDADLWELEHRVDGELIYSAYISPLTGHVLAEMSGIIVTTGLIAFVIAVAFWYLLHVIGRQRTIEEMKDDFTNNMTHELKTPIAIAYAANDALLQFPDSTDVERTRRYLSASLEQLSRLTGLVENILAMSMERRKHLSMTKERIELEPFLRSIVDNQKLRAGKECDISLECDPEAVIVADATHLANVVNNLIDNSIKYSNEDVVILVKADSQGISVTDNGIGIPEKSMHDLFKKFYRVPCGNTQRVRGYGIGLFYVKSIVDKHGWTISVDSKVGKGSRFTIKFS